MRHWLMKSEPDVFSIDDLARVGVEPWSGVRNYQARNFMRDDMREGDGVLFYHSSCAQPGTVASSVVFVSTGPLWVALVSPLLLKEHLNRSALLGLALALLGGTIVGLADACI